MPNKVCFKREENGEAVVYVDEGNGWKHFSASNLKPINPIRDGNGFPYFQAALKAGYENCGLIK